MRRNIVGFLMVIPIVGFMSCHRMDVGAVTTQLRIGMSKADLDGVMNGEKFLKEQIVQAWPGQSEEETRAFLWSVRRSKFIKPEDLLKKQMPFNGSVKAYSYLIKEERRFANPIYVEALFVFVDNKTEKVIGWADIEGLMEVRLWENYF